MRKLLLAMLTVIAMLSTTMAQFPAFTKFDGKKYYVNERSDSATKKYRQLFNLGDTIHAAKAYDLGEKADSIADKFEDSIDAIGNTSSLTDATSNRLMYQLSDSVSLYRDAARYFYSINKFTGNPRKLAWFLPVNKTYQAKFFYQNSPKVDSADKNFDLLTNFILQTNIKKSAISSDLLRGAIWIFNVRLWTTVIDNSDSTSTEEKLNDKLNYGALVNLGASLPLLYRATKHFGIIVPISYNFSLDNLPANKDTEASSSLMFHEVAVSLHMQIPIINTNYSPNNASLFFNGKLGFLDGNSKFYDRLDGFRHGFWLGRGTIGIDIKNKIRIAANFPLYASDNEMLKKQVTTLGVQFDPKFLGF